MLCQKQHILTKRKNYDTYDHCFGNMLYNSIVFFFRDTLQIYIFLNIFTLVVSILQVIREKLCTCVSCKCVDRGW